MIMKYRLLIGGCYHYGGYNTKEEASLVMQQMQKRKEMNIEIIEC